MVLAFCAPAMDRVYGAVVALAVFLFIAAFFTYMYHSITRGARAPEEAPLDSHADGL